MHRWEESPSVSGRIVDLGGVQGSGLSIDSVVASSGHQHSPIWQPCDVVIESPVLHRRHGLPLACARVENLGRALRKNWRCIAPSDDKHASIAQQDSLVATTGHVHRCNRAPRVVRGVEQSDLGHGAIWLTAPRHENISAIVQSRHPMTGAGATRHSSGGCPTGSRTVPHLRIIEQFAIGTFHPPSTAHNEFPRRAGDRVQVASAEEVRRWRNSIGCGHVAGG